MALLFDDISTEMSRARRYRADVELGQSVIDAMDEAVAVFSSAGQVVLTNTAYAGLWAHDPVASVGADSGVAALTAYWAGRTAPSPIWAGAEDFVAMIGSRSAWAAEARLVDGRLISCRFVPLGGGATMAAFRLVAAEDGAGGSRISPLSMMRA